jgi:hypothetical protein
MADDDTFCTARMNQPMNKSSTSSMNKSSTSLAVVAFAAAFWNGNLRAQFPALGDDTVSSLGVVEIVVNPVFQPYATNLPGWNPVTQRLWTPVLVDPANVIGRSSPLTAGSPADVNGTPVGTAGTIVSNASFALVPAGFQPSAGTREVRTELRALDGSAAGVELRAGTNTPGQPPSLGSVNSLSPSGNPATDFPAQGFFDVYGELVLPGIGTVSNATPVVLVNNSVTGLPGSAVYTQANAQAVPLFFETNNPALNANAGDTFGLVLVAGYGTDMDTNDISSFQTNVQSQAETPVSAAYQTWAPNLNAVVTITSINVVGGGTHATLVITGLGVIGAEYELDSTASLSSPDWQLVKYSLDDEDGFFFQFYVAPYGSLQFFRVRQSN